MKEERHSRAQFELEVLESCRETHSGDYGEDSTDDSDDEEIIAPVGLCCKLLFWLLSLRGSNG